MIEKFLIYVIIGLGFILIGFNSSTSSHSYVKDDAVSNIASTTNSSNNPINFTTFFHESKDFRQCYGLGTICVTAIDVLFESPNTLALSSQFPELVWMAVDEVKKVGYKIDDVTTFETMGFSSNVPSTNFLVIMSR